MEYMLPTDKLTKIYGKKRAADDISLHIKKGDVYGLIGRNGAGKTTILKMICGLSTPTSGTVTFKGKTGSALSHEMNKIGYSGDLCFETFRQMSVPEELAPAFLKLIYEMGCYFRKKISE